MNLKFVRTSQIESFIFEDEYDFGILLKLKVFSRIVEKYSTREASLYYSLPEKGSAVIFIGEGYSPFLSAK